MKGLFGDVPIDDVQARGFDTSTIFSDLNKGTQALGARGFDLSDVKGILDTVIAGLPVRDDVDDIQARRFGLLNVKGILDTVKNVAGLLVRDDVDDIQARGFDASTFSNALGARALIRPSDVKGILGTVKDIAGLLARGDVDDVQARGFDTSTLSSLNKGTQALGARALIRPSDVKGILGTVKDIASLLVRDDVDDSVLEDAFLQAISRRSVSELEARGEVSSIFQAIKDIFQVVSRRDVTPEQLIALASLASTRSVWIVGGYYTVLGRERRCQMSSTLRASNHHRHHHLSPWLPVNASVTGDVAVLLVATTYAVIVGVPFYERIYPQ
ncbi:hypothetical protein EDB83DRAFT_2434119 [Lactarius deliciosus]|nr:hypothetical protein EDB83DRAFT_2434119 [Lactarius deliciosus]